MTDFNVVFESKYPKSSENLGFFRVQVRSLLNFWSTKGSAGTLDLAVRGAWEAGQGCPGGAWEAGRRWSGGGPGRLAGGARGGLEEGLGGCPGRSGGGPGGVPGATIRLLTRLWLVGITLAPGYTPRLAVQHDPGCRTTCPITASPANLAIVRTASYRNTSYRHWGVQPLRTIQASLV